MNMFLGGFLMFTCTKCRKIITQEPYYSITDRKTYCSQKCIPDDAFDQLYSFEYVNLVSSYRYFESEKYNLETIEERIQIENEMDEVIEDYKSYYLSDLENSYYKSQIIRLYEKLLILYEEIHDILKNKRPFVYYDVTIYWAELKLFIDKEILQKIFKDLIQCLEQSKIEFRNLSYDANNEFELSLMNYKDIICVETKSEQKTIIKILMDIFAKYYTSLIYDEETFTDHIYNGTVKLCPVCLHWEDESDFEFDEDLNVEACKQWDSCRNFPE